MEAVDLLDTPALWLRLPPEVLNKGVVQHLLLPIYQSQLSLQERGKAQFLANYVIAYIETVEEILLRGLSGLSFQKVYNPSQKSSIDCCFFLAQQMNRNFCCSLECLIGQKKADCFSVCRG